MTWYVVTNGQGFWTARGIEDVRGWFACLFLSFRGSAYVNRGRGGENIWVGSAWKAVKGPFASQLQARQACYCCREAFDRKMQLVDRLGAGDV